MELHNNKILCRFSSTDLFGGSDYEIKHEFKLISYISWTRYNQKRLSSKHFHLFSLALEPKYKLRRIILNFQMFTYNFSQYTFLLQLIKTLWKSRLCCITKPVEVNHVMNGQNSVQIKTILGYYSSVFIIGFQQIPTD